jgi:hypothetical protein
MLKRILNALTLPLLCATVAAQQPPESAPPAPPAQAAPPPKQAAAGAEAPVNATDAEKAEAAAAAEVKVLKPGDVPAELVRIEQRKNKADIKCEVTITPTNGREITVKGVVRNGKLIERFEGRSFVQDPTIENPQCGVRLWWVDNTSGWIFLRYSQIHTIALTGVLTAEEKKKIMEALLVKENEKKEEARAQEAAKLDDELAKMSTTELEAYLLREYPQEQGWTSDKLRDLKKKQLIDNQPLTRQESVFVTYYTQLLKARIQELKREKDKVEFQPGSAEKPADAAPSGGGAVQQPVQQPAGSGDDGQPASGDDE